MHRCEAPHIQYAIHGACHGVAKVRGAQVGWERGVLLHHRYELHQGERQQGNAVEGTDGPLALDLFIDPTLIPPHPTPTR
jgi:hypothetical protein